MKVYNKPIKAAIFDVDGTVLDTIPLYWKANTITMGKTFPPEFQSKVNGVSDVDEANTIIKHFNLSLTTEEFIQNRIKNLQNILPEADLVPGIEKIIRKINKMKLPMAVATSSHRETYILKTRNHQKLFELFKASVCGNEISKGKPSPEIFLTAASKICENDEIKPENILVFEDATFGVKAANDGGFPVVLLKTSEGEGVFGNLKKNSAEPTLLLESFNDFDFDSFEWELPTK